MSCGSRCGLGMRHGSATAWFARAAKGRSGGYGLWMKHDTYDWYCRDRDRLRRVSRSRGGASCRSLFQARGPLAGMVLVQAIGRGGGEAAARRPGVQSLTASRALAGHCALARFAGQSRLVLELRRLSDSGRLCRAANPATAVDPRAALSLLAADAVRLAPDPFRVSLQLSDLEMLVLAPGLLVAAAIRGQSLETESGLRSL